MRAKTVKFTQNQEDQISLLYNDGYGSPYIGKLFNVSSSRILFFLNKKNIKRNGNKFSNVSSNEDKQKMIDMYSNGMTLEAIAKELGIYKNAVRTILVNKHIKRRKTKDIQKMFFDKKFFSIKNDKLAYFYGFVLGDGTYGINYKIPKIKVVVHTKDISILENFCDWMSINKSYIFYYKNKKCVELAIRDHILSQNKKYWGVIENKTYNPILPTIKNKKILKRFLIGLIDADGHVVYGNNKGGQFQLVGNTKIMEWFIDSIKKLGYSGQIVHRTYTDKVWSRVCIQNKKDLISFAKILQVDTCDFLLDRKWHNIKDFLQNEV